MRPLILLITSLLALPAAAANRDASAPAAAPRQGAMPAPPSIGRVLDSVRAAVGYRSLAALPNGFSITESPSDGAPPRTLLFGTRRGELRNGEEFGFDGYYAWQHDGRRDAAVPSPLRQREKAAFPLWVRSHWWLNPKSGIAIKVVAAETDSRTVALSLSRKDGLIAATLYIDRATWLPSRLVVPYERGPFTATYRDYRRVRGLNLPFTVETHYRDRATGRVLAVAPLAGRGMFAAPALPADHRFNAALPAALETAAGAPLAPGVAGHIYVRAAADGQAGWWHFDSGSDSMIIDSSVADALHMPVIGTHRSMGADGIAREGTWRRGKSFTLGRIRIENPIYRAIDLSANNAPPGERRMGTIGYDLFARSVVEYAAGGRNVRICEPSGYRLPRGARWRPLDFIDATPAARGRVERRAEGLFQIDTGSAGTIDFARPFHETHRLLAERRSEASRSLGSGGSFAVQRGRISRFDFAGRSYRDLEVLFRMGGVSREGSAGTLGRTILEPFTTVFDYSNRRIAFVPPAAGKGTCG
jgi:hypothetical protein